MSHSLTFLVVEGLYKSIFAACQKLLQMFLFMTQDECSISFQTLMQDISKYLKPDILSLFMLMLLRSWEDGKFIDFTLICEGKHIGIHKIIACTQLEIF